MKRLLIFPLLFFFVATFWGGYLVGERKGKGEVTAVIGATAEQQLALDIEILNELAKGDLAKARWMIQTGTAGKLEAIIDFSSFKEGSNLRFKCALLARYKKYYSDSKLFEGPEWDAMMEVAGMKEAEAKRRIFLESTLPQICP